MKLKITSGYGWYLDKIGKVFDIVRSVTDDSPFAYVVGNPGYFTAHYVRHGDFVLIDEAPTNSFFPINSINIVPKDAHYSVGVIKMENSDNVCIIVMRDNVLVHLGQHEVQE